MKYHYQYVSKTTVRIELIPEDKKEAAHIEQLSNLGQINNTALQELYQTGLESYTANTSLTKVKYMSFPKVALCNFVKVDVKAEATS